MDDGRRRGLGPGRPGPLGGGTNRTLRIVLILWALAYPVIACGPVFITEGLARVLAGGVGIALAVTLLVPWVLGLVVLGVLVYITNPRRRY